jgi:hypothetical protein
VLFFQARGWPRKRVRQPTSAESESLIGHPNRKVRSRCTASEYICTEYVAQLSKSSPSRNAFGPFLAEHWNFGAAGGPYPSHGYLFIQARPVVHIGVLRPQLIGR